MYIYALLNSLGGKSGVIHFKYVFNVVYFVLIQQLCQYKCTLSVINYLVAVEELIFLSSIFRWLSGHLLRNICSLD